jgi:hypothetical protein
MYRSADIHTDVDAPGYFSNGAQLGLAAGDVMIVHSTTGPTCTIHVVLNATTIAAATLV